LRGTDLALWEVRFFDIPCIWLTYNFVFVGFLYPAFLIAGLTLAVPLLIHLFNLRRYKTVFFPHTRFLKAIQLRSRRSSEVRYKWLLALRMLFLASLVAAFAQPLFKKTDTVVTDKRLQVIYIDNNPAMNLKKGARSGLDAAVDAARRQVSAAPAGTRFLLLTNDKPFAYEPQPAEKVLSALGSIEIAPAGKSSAQVFSSIQSGMQTESAQGADLYYYSDFSRGSFPARPDAGMIKGVTLHAIAVQPATRSNVFIDTAFFTSPVLQTGQNNALIVRSRRAGAVPKNQEDAQPVMQLAINGQVKSAASLQFDAAGRSVDTLSFSVSDAGWQRISLAVADASLRFDDTFRVAARSAPGLSILVLNEGAASPYIMAAFRSYNGFSLRTENVGCAPGDWKPYNLIILNGITNLPDAVGKQVKGALDAGQSVCIFPGKTRNLDGLNSALGYAGDIRVSAFDTSNQSATNLQPGADLVKDVFEGIPANVQLPVATWHYSIQAGFSANGQSILSFRNGDPLLARYTPSKGALYICATSADIEGGNFPASYFFVPFLYQMAAQSRGGDMYALTAGRQQAAFLPIRNTDERNMVHLYAGGLDAIPPQRAAGGGVDVFVDAVVQAPGFYTLAAPSGDSAVIALNGTRAYSNLDLWDMKKLQDEWPDRKATWQTPETAAAAATTGSGGELPLWKVCAILALILLAAETYLLTARRDSTATVATS
jgi:hypothetical protein